jgi:hypothetical protein
MFDMGLGVELCWPYQPRQKGSVENLVGWVKSSFFKQRRFLDMDDLLAQLHEWLQDANFVRASRATGETPGARLHADQARLRPLRVSSDEFALQFAASVGPTAEVAFEGGRYAMSPEAIGLPATLSVYKDRVRIVAGRHRADHPRLKRCGAISCLPEHRSEHLAAVSGRRGKRYLQRQHLLDFGPLAEAFLSEVVHRRPGTWYRDVETLHRLLQEHGDSVLLAAVERALLAGVYGAEYVVTFVEGRAEMPRTEVTV